MKKAIAIAVLAVAALALSGCGDDDADRMSYEEEQIQLGKACFDAGGEWIWDGWVGWICEFRRD